MRHSTIREVEIIGLRGIFRCEGINLLHIGNNAGQLATFAHQHLSAFDFHLAFHAECTRYLEICEALALGPSEQFVVEHIDIAHGLQFTLRFVDIVELTQEPAIDFCEAMNIFHGISVLKCLLNNENTLVCGRFEGGIHIFNGQFAISHEAVHTLSDHAEAFLDHFFESATDGHHFSHRFHRTAELAIHTAELAQVPTRNFAHHIVESRFEEGRSRFRHRVFQVEKSVAQAQFSGNKGQRIAGGFRSERRTTTQTRIYLNHTVIFTLGIEGILHITLTHDADMAHNADRQLAKFVIFAVGQRLRRGNHDRFARVNAERVEVFHIAHRDAIVEAVAHHFILHFFPALQALFDQNLRGERESLLGQFVEFGLIVAKSRSESAQCVGRTNNHGIAQRFGGAARIFQRFHGLALDRFDIDLV